MTVSVASQAASPPAGEGSIPRMDLYTNAAMRENLSLYPRLGWVETDRRTEDGFERVYFEKPVSHRRAKIG